MKDGLDMNLVKARDLLPPANVPLRVRSYMITNLSFPSDLGSQAASLQKCLSRDKCARRRCKHLRTADTSNSRFSPLEHNRDNDRAATVRYERESGDESARR